MKKMIPNVIHYVSRTGSMAVCFSIARLVKCSLIIGGQTAFFSGTSIVMPVLGSSQTGFFAMAIACLLHTLGMFFLSHSSINILSIYHIPLLVASALMMYRSHLSVLVFFIGAQVAFIVHPTGNAAWIYACLWFIPILAKLWGNNSLVARAVVSTFGAHAVGSLLYLYTVPMAAETWIALMPIALTERSCFAVGIIGFAYTLEASKKIIQQLPLVNFGISNK